MIFSFLVFVLFTSFISGQSDRKNQTCLLPFVTEPCINDGQNLSCRFSLNSLERRKTCDLSSVSLIFTTIHVELFVIPQYYNQIILADQHFINKLIIEPEIINRTFTYFHWTNIPILSLEIPIDIFQYEIIHETQNLQVMRTTNHMNKQYWHLKMWPINRFVCKRTIINRENFITKHYYCPNDHRVCGHAYVCLDDEPCYYTGYRRLVCQTSILQSSMHFSMPNNTFQYEIIFIVALASSLFTIHEIEQESFLTKTYSIKPSFITKHAVFIINTGILQISKELFSNVGDFQVRIEHSKCTEKRFVLDVLDDDNNKDFINAHLFDYTDASIGGIECHLNLTDTRMINQFKPFIEPNLNTLVHAEHQNDITFVLYGLPPFIIKWFRNNTLVETDASVISNIVRIFDISHIIDLAIHNTTKADNGIEYRVHATNRLGQYSATTQLNVTYKPTFVTSLRNQTAKQGSNITLQANIDGNPIPDVYILWLDIHERLYPTYDDQLMYQYKLQNVQANQSTSYTFFVISDTYKKNISQTAHLTIFDLLYVMNPIHTIDINEENYFNLTLRFSHTLTRTQWFTNNIPIENTSISYNHYIEDDQIVLIIDNISLSHNGLYKVQVWDELNQTNQSQTFVHIYTPLPSIVYCYNETLEKKLWLYFICRFQAKNPQIQWIDSNGQVLLNQSTYESTNESAHIFDARLVFKKIEQKYFGIYTFQVNNSGGSVIQKINFTVQETCPIIGYNNFTLEKVYIHQGHSHSFIVYFTGIPWPNVTIFFNNDILLTYINPNASPVILSLRNVSTDNEGIYYVRVMNSEGSIETNRTEIYILRAPSFILKNHSSSSIVSVQYNRTITLITPKINTGNADSFVILWFVKENSFKQSFNSIRTLVANLTIDSSLQQEQIACVIENQYGALIHFFNLNFLQEPSFILTLPKQMYAEMGESITLTINVTGNPLPTIQWFHNQHKIHTKLLEFCVTTDVGLSTLIIKDFTSEDVGNYRVIANNSENTISSETYISLKSTIFPVNITSSTRTMKSIPTCGDTVTLIIVIGLVFSLIAFVLISVLCTQKRLVTFFNYQTKNHYEIERNTPLSLSNTSEIE